MAKIGIVCQMLLLFQMKWFKKSYLLKSYLLQYNMFYLVCFFQMYEGISKSFEPNMERARNLDLFCFIFQRSPLPTPHTCPI